MRKYFSCHTKIKLFGSYGGSDRNVWGSLDECPLPTNMWDMSLSPTATPPPLALTLPFWELRKPLP